MHPRNKYFNRKPDFAELGRAYPAFAAFLRPNSQGTLSIDWQDPAAVLELNKILLLHDFHLVWDMPLNRLCPPIANRANYIHWLEDLLAQQSLKETGRGIDIGTGASCIYPLLGYRIANWSFLATEIDPVSVDWAQKNIDANKLGAFIQVRHVTSADLLQTALVPEDGDFDFCMCNPPFFEDEEQAAPSRRTACMGSALEMAVDGGEVGFVKRMIADSMNLQKRIVWYTCMLGRKSSLQAVLASLREHKIHTTRSTTFVQGSTVRWGIAWSFFTLAPAAPKDTVLGSKKEARRKNDASFVIEGLSNGGEVCARVSAWLNELPKNSIHWEETQTDHSETKLDSFSISGHVCSGWRGESKKRTLDGESVASSAPLFHFLVNIERELGSASSELSTSSAWKVSVHFVGGSLDSAAGPRQEFWQFVDLLHGEVTRTTRKWRRKLTKQGSG